VQQVQLVDERSFFQQFDGAVHRNQVNARVNLFRRQKLVHVKCCSARSSLAGSLASAGQTNAPLAKSALVKWRVVSELLMRSPVDARCAGRGGHEKSFKGQRIPKKKTCKRNGARSGVIGINPTTSLYMTYANSNKRNTNPTCTEAFLTAIA